MSPAAAHRLPGSPLYAASFALAVAALGCSPPPDHFAVAVAAGCDHTCALLRDSTVRCWGDNSDGQLGNGELSANGPFDAGGLAGVSALAAGQDYTCAQTTSGTVECWGNPEFGTLGTDSDSTFYQPTLVPGVDDAVQIRATGHLTCTSNSTGQVKCWGAASFQQCGAGLLAPHPVIVGGLPSASDFAPGKDLCVLNQGQAFCLGPDDCGSGDMAIEMPGVDNAIGIRTDDPSCALLNDATVTCWGNNNTGQLGDGTVQSRTTAAPVLGLADVAGIAVGALHSCAWMKDGTAACWGEDVYGELGSGSPNVSYDAGAGSSDVIATTPQRVQGLEGVTSMSVGCLHTCATVADGSVWCWGDNMYGQLGASTTAAEHSAVPVRLPF